ncbi:hypothetical protein BDW72DRAFT_167203 [Aspergillus terricola var. indicus]
MKQPDSPLKSPSRKDSLGSRQDLSNSLSRCSNWRKCRNLANEPFSYDPCSWRPTCFYINRDPLKFQSDIAHQSSAPRYAILQPTFCQPRLQDSGAMATQSTLRTIAHLWVASTFLALAFGPLGFKYEVAGTHLARRANTLGGDTPAITETGDSERPYAVDGNTFTDYESAAQRSCNIQFDNCQLIANTDSSASFSLEDCQSQQSDCIADPPSVADGSSSMSVASVDTSDTSETSAEESETPSDTAASATAGSNSGSETAESNTVDNYAGELSTTESDADGSDNSESDRVSVAASGTVESEATESETAPDTAESGTGDSDTTDASDTTESNAAGSNSAEADSAESDLDETEAGHTKTETTEASPVLVMQTTIPYDSEFDLVCDL